MKQHLGGVDKDQTIQKRTVKTRAPRVWRGLVSLKHHRASTKVQQSDNQLVASTLYFEKLVTM